MRKAPDNIWDFLSPIVEGMDYNFVGASLGQTESGLTLRVYIDREGKEPKDQELKEEAGDQSDPLSGLDPQSGIHVEDCAAVSRQVGAALDVEDLIAGEYCLEVSSPGVDRPLFSESDFAAQIGNQIKLKMQAGPGARRNYKGVVVEVQDGVLTVEVDAERHELPVREVDSANLIGRIVRKK